MKKFERAFGEYLDVNKVLYIWVFLVFTAGLMLGSYFITKGIGNNLESLKISADNYILSLTENGVDKREVFFSSVKNNLITIFFIWISGFFIFMIPFALLQIFLKGFRLGFSIAYFVEMYSIRGSLFAFCQLIFGNVLFLPLIIFFAAFSIKFSKNFFKIKQKNIKGKQFVSNVGVFFAVCLISVLISLFEGYAAAPVMKAVSYLLK